MNFELVATSTFGVEAILKKEIKNLGYEITDSENGKISYLTDERGIVKSNLWLRTADRVYIKLSKFKAISFEDLFQNVKTIEWEKYIPIDANFTVNGSSVKSILHSVPACQSIIEKALIERLKSFYKLEWFEKTGSRYTIRFIFLNDECLIMLDTSGEALHKRGYRIKAVAAPIKETMAAALVYLSYFEKYKVLIDPMCGSGTIPIEAALIAKNIAPGLSRNFDAMNFGFIPIDIWKEEKALAFNQIKFDDDIKIFALDIDQKTLDYARDNAIEAGVDDVISFSCKDIKDLRFERLDYDKNCYASIITNPPYGQRIGNKDDLSSIYESLAFDIKKYPKTELNLITPDKFFEKKFGRKADKRRKLFNGNIESTFYQYFTKKDN